MREGRGGGQPPPKFSGNSDFLGSKRKFGQGQFLKTFPFFYYYYFEEINIFYFNLGVIIKIQYIHMIQWLPST